MTVSKAGQGGTIRIGVVGVGRGQSFARGATDVVGMKLVAICDIWEERLVEVGKCYGVATYTDYDRFLEHEMDAVILANYFHQHAPFAIKALHAGLHVMSETACNGTLAEGVALCRAVEETGRIYMLAENYPYTAFNQEMARLYRAGEIGRVTTRAQSLAQLAAADILLHTRTGPADGDHREDAGLGQCALHSGA
jgi:predicted dehydrogenase